MELDLFDPLSFQLSSRNLSDVILPGIKGGPLTQNWFYEIVVLRMHKLKLKASLWDIRVSPTMYLGGRLKPPPSVGSWEAETSAGDLTRSLKKTTLWKDDGHRMRPNEQSEHLRISRGVTLAAAHLAGEIQLCVGASGCYRSFGGERKLVNALRLVWENIPARVTLDWFCRKQLPWCTGAFLFFSSFDLTERTASDQNPYTRQTLRVPDHTRLTEPMFSTNNLSLSPVSEKSKSLTGTTHHCCWISDEDNSLSPFPELFLF